MAIRLRTINGMRLALCAFETDAKEGDAYLDDADHYALAAKFAGDWQGQTIDWTYSEKWAGMEQEKVRDAHNDFPHVSWVWSFLLDETGTSRMED